MPPEELKLAARTVNVALICATAIVIVSILTFNSCYQNTKREEIIRSMIGPKTAQDDAAATGTLHFRRSSPTEE